MPNNRQLDRELGEEAASVVLAEDASRYGGGGPYRRLFGILNAEQLRELHKKEFLCVTVGEFENRTGMYWRAHPDGRHMRSLDQRKKGMGVYA